MQLIEDFIEFYQALENKDISGLRDVYADNIEFIDPITQHRGIEQLEQYFLSLLKNTISCKFAIHNVVHQDESASINWTMTFQSRRIKDGKALSVDGCSMIRIENDKITYHRDFFDIGQMVYEHVPLVGWAVKRIKTGMAS
ncbi:nuclear transport factor 2 family protein [Aestuariibacter salexigens]|uniref:nuclear transport factor 2 family protein n=1 Tax=Aestuariibacter salexigens TaxID=226010 RepID=UPI0004017C38|nr:nuclear transport factor 2 family protein [Aestuariibacter salexigens]